MPPSPQKRDRPARLPWLVVAIVVAGGVLPVVIYGGVFGTVPTVTAGKAFSMLTANPQATRLVDVRQVEEFSTGRLDGACSWPKADILTLNGPQDVPSELQGKRLLLICNVGWDSVLATRHLRSHGVEDAINVRGGMQEWIHCAESLEPDQFQRWRMPDGTTAPLPHRDSPIYEQALAVLAFFVVKPIYTLLALGVIILLWRSRAPDLTALRWSMIFFFVGENFCAANYFVFKERSYLFEYLHSYGMLLSLGFMAFAVLDGIDRRILKLSDPDQRCSALGLCGKCIKQTDVPCGLKRLFYVIIPAMLIVAAMLPTADWQDTAYNTLVFDQVYNYAHLRVYQVFENWFCASAAMVLFALSFATLALDQRGGMRRAKILFAAGMGPLGFGLLRMLLGSAYDANRVWFLVWEEGTEFLLILAVGLILWIFRSTLAPRFDEQLRSTLHLLVPLEE